MRQPIIPSGLFRWRRVGVGRTWVGNDEEPAWPQPPRLLAQYRRGCVGGERAMHGAKAGGAVEAGDTRLVARELGREFADAGRELRPVELIGARRRPLDQICEAETVVREHAVVLGFERLNAE